MAGYSVEVRGLKELRAKIKNMDESLRNDMTIAVRDAGKLVENEAKRYPPASRRKMKFVSAKQRRYVMWLVRQGRVPYRRTHQLETSINTIVTAVGNDVVASVGTQLSYAPWVKGTRAAMGAGPQAKYHKGTWKTLQAHLNAKRPEIKAIFKKMLGKWIKT